jgi:hypothetical protein
MKKLLVILLLAILTNGFAQKPKKNLGAPVATIKIEQLELKYLQIQHTVDSLNSALRDGNEELKQAQKKFSLADEVYQKTKDSITMSDRIVNIFLGIISVLVAILGYNWYQTKRGINRLLENYKKESIKQISATANAQVENITQLLNKQSKETFLLENSRIIIINKVNTSIDKHLKLALSKFQIFPSEINVSNFMDVDPNSVKGYDVVIIDNVSMPDDKEQTNWNFNECELKRKIQEVAVLTCSQNNAFLFFGMNDGGFAKDLPKYRHLINFSNSPATLFANLIDLLDYRRLVSVGSVS